MSRRNEIKQKEQLQLQLQAQFNKLDQTVLSWLNPKSKLESNSASVITTTSKISEISNEFANQIVIPNGKGINFADSENLGPDNAANTVTISDFLANTGNKKKSLNDNKINKIGDVKRSKNGGHASNSLRALSTKIRNESRRKEQNGRNNNNYNKDNVNVRKFASKKNPNNSKESVSNRAEYDYESDGSDDEDDNEVLMRKTKGKGKLTLVKRPF
jgi:hypothetical protein